MVLYDTLCSQRQLRVGLELLVGWLVGLSQKVLGNRSKDFLDIWHNDRGHQTMRQYRAGFSVKNLDHSKIKENMDFLTVINFL